MDLELSEVVESFATGLMRADARRPQAINVRSKQPFQAGIGPHSESQTVNLVAEELRHLLPADYRSGVATGVPYPDAPRQRCDLCLGSSASWDWAIEVKMLRFLGDNGGLNDNILMHILSPYPAHRSALTDCIKLSQSALGRRKAVLIYGFHHDDWPLAPAIEAFERLAGARVLLGPVQHAAFHGLIHRVHSAGQVFAWEIAAFDATR